MKPTASVRVVKTKGKGFGIVASKRIRRGEKILEFPGELVFQEEVRNPNAALQLDGNLFLESHGSIDENLNHSCDPNCYVDFRQLILVALKEIQKGEELTFDYNTSEYDLIDQGCPFTCLCGSPNCVGEIKGFRYLPVDRKTKIEPFISPFLKRKWRKAL